MGPHGVATTFGGPQVRAHTLWDGVPGAVVILSLDPMPREQEERTGGKSEAQAPLLSQSLNRCMAAPKPCHLPGLGSVPVNEGLGWMSPLPAVTALRLWLGGRKPL